MEYPSLTAARALLARGRAGNLDETAALARGAEAAALDQLAAALALAAPGPGGSSRPGE
jgi:hypothetical protein